MNFSAKKFSALCKHAIFAPLLLGAASASADVTVQMYEATVDGKGKHIGSVKLSDNEHGLVLTPSLAHLEPGVHGFHVHTKSSCQAAEKDGKLTPAAAAGGHYDPENTGKHAAPWEDGHLGDLPALYVTQDGVATIPVLAPRATVKDVQGRALMIHAGGDNYSDEPKPLGGGGPRKACGIIEKS